MKLWLDVETTGLDPQRCAIVELAAVPVIDYIEKSPIYYTGIKPYDGALIEESAMKIHGINNFICESRETLLSFIKKLKEFNCKFVISGHNASFDKQFLYYWFCTFGEKSEFDNLFYEEVDCTLRRAKRNPKHKKHNLAYLCDFYKIELNGAHNALNDILATIKLSSMLESNETGKDNLNHNQKLQKYMNAGYIQINPTGDIYIHNKTTKDPEALRFILSELYNRFIS